MEDWVPPYKKKSAIPMRLCLYGFAILFASCAAIAYATSMANPGATVAVFIVLALVCLVPALAARDVAIERVWPNISWLRW